MKNLTLGCDPEFFLEDVYGKLKSSIGLIGGSKAYPQPLPLGDGFAVQEDNVAVEFNIPPAKNAGEYVRNIRQALGFIDTQIISGMGLRVNKQSAALFPLPELNNPAALEFGCEPDYNAWTSSVNPRPKAGDPTLRSCGGHVHIGFDQKETNVEAVVRMMDLHCGVPSVLMDHGSLRKELYGKAGAYRRTPFGGEYRSLSNFWIFDDRLITWVWNNTERAVSAAVEQLELTPDDQAAIVNCINNNDKDQAEMLISKFALEVV